MDQYVAIMKYLNACWRYRLHCVVIVGVIVGAGVIYALTATPVYEVRAIIVPDEFLGGGSGMDAGILGNIAVFKNVVNPQNNTLVIVLDSNALAERVVAREELLKVFLPAGAEKFDKKEQLRVAGERLNSAVKISRDRYYVEEIIISAKNADPQLANMIVQQYLVELQNYITSNSLTKAKRHRIFLETQLAKKKEELLEMGKMLANFYSDNSVSTSKAKLSVPIALKSSGNTVRDFLNYEEFKKYFEGLQGGSLSQRDVKYVEGVPHQVYLKYITMQQSMLESQVSAVGQSHQMALIDEVRNEPTFQVLEEPMVPRHRVSPQRRRIVMISFFIGNLCAIGYCLSREYYIQNLRTSLSAIVAAGRLKTMSVHSRS